MQKNFRRVLLGLAIIGMLFTLIGPAQQVGAAPRTFSDLKNHWAAGYINEWNSLGLVSGYPDGTFGPARLMTKAEFITFVNRAFGYTKVGENTFSDVKKNDWFAGDVAKAIGMGYTQGNANGTFQPNQPISRLEAARILYKVLRLEPVNQDSLAEYTDAGSLSAADKPMVNSIVAGDYFGGYSDKTLRMSSTITRAEMIVVLARGAGEIYNQPTTFGPATGMLTLNGNATINKTGITLQNTTIKGDLYITEGVGEGTFYLKNVTVLGRTIVAGGGSHSISLVHTTGSFPFSLDGGNYVLDLSDASDDLQFTGVRIITDPSGSATLRVTGADVLGAPRVVDKSYILNGDTLPVTDLMSLVHDVVDPDLALLVELVMDNFDNPDISLTNLRGTLGHEITLTGELTQQVNGHTITSGVLTITIILSTP